MRLNHLNFLLVTCILLFSVAACGGGSQTTPPSENKAPVITGAALTAATIGSSYSFTPGATDDDGDALTYSASGVPAWATFNTTTHTLSGTPASAGSYGPITISVTDGKASASLSPFTIVVSPSTGSATLTWIRPTQNTDGSALIDLKGYRIYYGISASNLTSSQTIQGAETLTASITGLATGTTYYFAIASINNSDVEGDKSNVASKTI